MKNPSERLLWACMRAMFLSGIILCMFAIPLVWLYRTWGIDAASTAAVIWGLASLGVAAALADDDTRFRDGGNDR